MLAYVQVNDDMIFYQKKDMGKLFSIFLHV